MSLREVLSLVPKSTVVDVRDAGTGGVVLADFRKYVLRELEGSPVLSRPVGGISADDRGAVVVFLA